MTHIVSPNNYTQELNDLLNNLSLVENTNNNVKPKESALDDNVSSVSTFSQKISSSSKTLSALRKEGKTLVPSLSMLSWSSVSAGSNSFSIFYDRSDKHYTEDNYSSYKTLRAILGALLPRIEHALSESIETMKNEFGKQFEEVCREICCSTELSSKEVADLRKKCFYTVVLVMNVIAKEAEKLTRILVNTEVQESSTVIQRRQEHVGYKLAWHRDTKPEIKWHAHILLEFQEGHKRIVIEFLPSTSFVLTHLNLQKIEELLKLVKSVVIATPNSMNSFYFKVTGQKMQQIHSAVSQFTDRVQTCRNPTLSCWELETHKVQFVCSDNPLIESDWHFISSFGRILKPLTIVTQLSHFALKYYDQNSSDLMQNLQSLLVFESNNNSSVYCDMQDDNNNNREEFDYLSKSINLSKINDSALLSVNTQKNLLNEEYVEERSFLDNTAEDQQQQQQEQHKEEEEEKEKQLDCTPETFQTINNTLSTVTLHDAANKERLSHSDQNSAKPRRPSHTLFSFPVNMTENEQKTVLQTQSTPKMREQDLPPVKTPKNKNSLVNSPRRLMTPLINSARKNSADLMDLTQRDLQNLSLDEKLSAPKNLLPLNKVQTRRPPTRDGNVVTTSNTDTRGNKTGLNLPPIDTSLHKGSIGFDSNKKPSNMMTEE